MQFTFPCLHRSGHAQIVVFQPRRTLLANVVKVSREKDHFGLRAKRPNRLQMATANVITTRQEERTNGARMRGYEVFDASLVGIRDALNPHGIESIPIGRCWPEFLLGQEEDLKSE